MKKKRIAILVATLLFAFTAAGCGDPLLEMTQEEEDTIVAYAAKMVSKYNIYQKDGIMFVSDETVAKAEDKNPEQGNGAADNPGEPEVTKCSMREALRLSGVDISFMDIKVSDHFDDGSVSSIVAKSGAKFVILKFNMVVTKSQEIDLFSKGPVFKLSLNGKEYSQKTTVMPSDLATFVDSVKAGTNKTVVLLYEIPADRTESIDSYSLSVSMEIDGQTVTNAIEL